MHLKALLIGLVLLNSPLTFAAWREASSEHFVIYADDSERDLRTFSEKMERYHQAMVTVFPSHLDAPSPSNRLVVYVLGNENQVRKLQRGDSGVGRLLGFYVPRAGNSAAFMPAIHNKATGEVSESERVLMQEYAHHIRRQNLNTRTPTWFNTGFAEYFASASFYRNGDVILGSPNNYRAEDFTRADVRQIDIEELLDSATHASHQSNTRADNFAVRSWSLFHYLYSNQDGKAKMADYLNRLNRGETELDSARAAFGDLSALNRELTRYLARSIQAWRIPNGRLSVAPIAIKELNSAEAASLAVRMQFASGIRASETERIADVLREARELATQYPDEPDVQAVLAEAEYTAGNDDATITAADKALAFNPNHMNALIQKGYALTRIATNTKDPAAWAKMRSHFLAINKIEPDNPIALLYYYGSFVGQGELPTQNAISGLEWALQLAPYDASLRLTAARAQINQKRYQEAIQTLSVPAFSANDNTKDAALALLETAQQALAAQSASAAEVEGVAAPTSAAAQP
ncbi:MAG: hypothetical protein LBF16_05145 [Pseudomonadales bacterium]|nr:hypothetical protein [Pseudomonadales bacterium]